MKDGRAEWNEVGERFVGIRSKLEKHFAQRARGEGAGGPDEPPEPGAADELRDALRSLGDALESTMQALGAAARDPEVTEDVKRAGQSLVNALNATFSDVGDDIRQAFRRSATDDKG
jgi:ElaB/YqjD/DUF883 family membrane-anchored ribosome-binding protein